MSAFGAKAKQTIDFEPHGTVCGENRKLSATIGDDQPPRIDIALNKTQPSLLLLQRNAILFLLMTLAAAAWAVLVWQHGDVGMDMTSATGLRAMLFIAIWVVMMVAMMFPTAAPMILAFHQVQVSKRQSDDAFASVWAFVAAYLLVWTLAGVAVYAVVAGIEIPAIHNAFGPTSVAQFGGAILITAGIYQLTPLKEAWLYECRTPINTTSWYREKTDAFRLGLLHGAYCVGCYWLLFAILFPLGMSIGAMAVVTLIILAEKMLPRPTLVSYAVGAVLVLYGALVITSPQLLPS